jgi:hypothetical protein
MSRRSEHPLLRATALVGVLCVLLLSVFAASPGWHAGLHDHEDESGQHAAVPADQAGHVCAVTLWASGATALLVFCLLTLLRPLAASVFARAGDAIIPSLPRYRLVPSHAPPSA